MDLITATEWLLWGDAALWIVLTLVGIIDHMLYPPLGPYTPDMQPAEGDNNTLWTSQPLVSVIIPARNEQRNIDRCLNSVVSQTHHNFEVWVVDDQSEDDTAARVQAFAERDDRFHLLAGTELPEGWVGKGWALYQGHQQARGSWVVLLDADTELDPEALATTVRYAVDNEIDLLNPTPYFVNNSFWEKALQPVLWGLVMTRFPMMWVNSPLLKENMAFGPFMLIRKRVYDAVDGHRQVCHDILEDVALARLIKGSGYRTQIVNGKYLFSIRMYENFHEILEGWVKTAYGAMNYSLPLMTIAILGLFYMALFPILMLTGVLIAWIFGMQPVLLPAASAAVAALYGRRIWDMFRFRFGFVALGMHAISMLVVQYMQINAVWRYYFGTLNWKGRAYKPREEKRRQQALIAQQKRALK